MLMWFHDTDWHVTLDEKPELSRNLLTFNTIIRNGCKKHALVQARKIVRVSARSTKVDDFELTNLDQPLFGTDL